MLSERLSEYVNDNESPVTNFNLGLEYEFIGQGSSAIGFYLRSAERGNDSLISYESLIHMGYIFDGQGKRGRTALSCWRLATTLMPKRPEAYYYISRYHNWHNDYDQGYTLSSMALEFCDFDSEKLYCTYYIDPSKYELCLKFEKGLSGWWWGKVEESKSILLNLYNEHLDELPVYQKNLLVKYLKEELKVI